MRITKLRFKNLNALVGEWEIDFSKDAYLTEGIFLISGPTGAGKSTVLDAISLALFASTPRLGKISRGNNEVMARHTGECMAEVTIETPKGCYRCSFRQHRARKSPKGELQTPLHEIADADTGTVLETHLRRVLVKVEQVTGMDFDRFTRSMLLAQGGFAAFLNANPDDRSPILEQITGTELYSRISILLHEKWREAQETLTILRAGLDGEILLDEATREGLKNEKQRLERDALLLNGRVETLREQVSKHVVKEKLDDEIALLSEEKQAITARWDGASDVRNRLDAAHRAVQVEGIYGEVSFLKHELRSDQQTCSSLDAELPILKDRLAEKRVILEKAKSAVEAGQQSASLRRSHIAKTRLLDAAVAEKQQRMDRYNIELKKNEARLSRLKCTIETDEAECQRIDEALNRVTMYLADNQVDEGLVQQLTGIEARFNHFEESFLQFEALGNELSSVESEQEILGQTLTAKQTEQIRKKNELDRAQERHRVLSAKRKRVSEQSVSELKEHEKQLEVKLSKALSLKENIKEENRLKEALERCRTHQIGIDGCLSDIQKQLAQCEDEIGHRKREITLLEENVTLRRRVEDLENERRFLEDHKPCPLCGSTEHPYALGNVPEVEDAVQLLNSARSALDASTEKMVSLKSEQAKHQSTHAHLQQTAIELNGQLKALEQTMSQTCALFGLEIEELMSSIEGLHLTLETQLNDAVALSNRVGDLDRQIEKSNGQLSEIKEDSQRNDHQIEQMKLKLAGLRETASRLLARQTEVDAKQEADAKRLLESIQRYGIPTLNTHNLASVIEELTSRRQKWLDSKRTEDTLQNAKRELVRHLSVNREKCESCQNRQDELFASISAIECTISDDMQQRQALLQDADPDAEELAIHNMLKQLAASQESAQRQFNQLSEEVSVSIHALSSLSERIANRQSVLKKQIAALQTRLLSLGFSSEDAFLQSRMSDSEKATLEAMISELSNQRNSITAKLTDREMQQKEAQSYIETLPPKETLLKQQEEAIAAYTACQQQLGSVTQKLLDDDQAHKNQEKRIKAVTQQEIVFERLDALHSLIGSRDGKKFRNFAQGLTLQTVLSHANRQLSKMSDRYRLIRDTSEPLALNVIDSYQAGEIRSTKNLSGGESFIVSLALALGLSKMASQNVRVDALFLDEGFGTLDDEHLDTALNTLAMLRQEGKLIGLISHVPALKERISTQIELMPTAGGRSRLRGPGCQRLK